MANEKNSTQTIGPEALRAAVLMISDDRKIPVAQIRQKLSDALLVVARKECKDKDKDSVSCYIDPKTYEIIIKQQRTVVEEISNPNTDITVEDAQKYKPGAVVGAIIEVPIDTSDFGRIAAQTVKHVFRQGLKELEHGKVFEEFKSRKHEIVTARVTQVDPRTGDIMVQMGNFEVPLRQNEQVPGETFEPGDLIKVYVNNVDIATNGSGVVVQISRVCPELVSKLFENEVPEIFEGAVEIRAITREAGSRTKMAVSAKDTAVDPVGACIGPKGARVGKVIALLGGEKIDIVKYSDDPVEFIAAALAPAAIIDVEILDDDHKQSRVYVPEQQLSLAIGNKGQNARLAAKLTGWKIDIVSDETVSIRYEDDGSADDGFDDTDSAEEADESAAEE